MASIQHPYANLPCYSNLHSQFADIMIKLHLEVYHQQLDNAQAVLQLDPMWNNLPDEEKAAWVHSIATKSAD